MSKQARVVAPHGFPDFSLLPFSAVVQLFDALQTCADVKPPIATMLSNLCRRMGAHPIPKEQQVYGLQSLFSLLLPAYAQRNYGVAQATLPRFLIEQLDIYSKSSQQALKACATGNLNNLIAQVAKAIEAYYVPKSKGVCPDPTVRDVCVLLDAMSSDGRDRKHQQATLRHFYNSFHVPKGMLLWLLRVILKDLGLSISDKVWSVFGKECVDAFNSGRSLQAISQHIIALYNPSSLTSSTTTTANDTITPSSAASLRLHTGFSPMLASRLDLKNLVSRVGSAVWCVEDKLDGERMLVHIDRARNPPFRLFSRAVRERTAEYGFVFARDVFPCLPQRVDKCVLDGELMAVYEDTFVRMRHLRSVAGYNPKLGKNVQINISEDKPVLPKGKGSSAVADDDASSGDDGDSHTHTSITVSSSAGGGGGGDVVNMVPVSACRLQLHVFDVPVYHDRDISKMPYYARRALLAHLLRDEEDADGTTSGVSSASNATGDTAGHMSDVKVDIGGASGGGAGAGVRAGLEALGGDNWDDDLMWDEPDPVNNAVTTPACGNTGDNGADGLSAGGALGDDEALVAARQGVVLCHQFLLHTDDASAEDMSIAEQLHVTRISIPRDAKSVQKHLLACLAASELRANEGLVLKSLRSPYQLGPNRAQAWLKLKRDLIGQGPSADCVLIGLDQSSKRTNAEMDKFVLGLPVEREGRRVFYSFVRLGNLSGEMRARLRRLAGTALPYNPRAPPPHLAGVPVDGLRYYYPSPSVVVEAYCYQLSFNASDPAGFTAALACKGVGIASKSQVSTCGVSMRFPRFKAIREDKTLADCDTVESVVALASSVAAVDADDALTEHYCTVMREQVDAQGGIMDRTGRNTGLGVGVGAGHSSGVGSIARSPRSPRSPRVPMSPARSRGSYASGCHDTVNNVASGGVSGVAIRPALTLLDAFGGPSLSQWDVPTPSQSQSLLLSSGPMSSDASSGTGVSVETSMLDVDQDAKGSDAVPAAVTDEASSRPHPFPCVGKRVFPIFRSPAEMTPQEREAYLQRHPYLRQCLPPAGSPAAEAERRVRAHGREAILQISLARRHAMMWPQAREAAADERTFEANHASHVSPPPSLQSPWRVPPRTRQLASMLVPAPPASLLPSAHESVSLTARMPPAPVTPIPASTGGAAGRPSACPPATAAERVVLEATQRWVAMLPASVTTARQESGAREGRPMRPHMLDTGPTAVLGVVRLLRRGGLGIADGRTGDQSASVKVDGETTSPSPSAATVTNSGLNAAANADALSLLVKAEPMSAVPAAFMSSGPLPPPALQTSQHAAASLPHSHVSLTSSASNSTTGIATTATSTAARDLIASAASSAAARPLAQTSVATSGAQAHIGSTMTAPVSKDVEDAAVEDALRTLGTKRSRRAPGIVPGIDTPRKRARTNAEGTTEVATARVGVAGSDEDDDITVMSAADSSNPSLESDPLSTSLSVDHPFLALLHRLWRKGQLPAGLTLPPPAILVAAQAAGSRVQSSSLPLDRTTKHITSLPGHIQTFIAAIPPLPLPPSLSFALLALCLQYQVNPEILAAFSEQQLRRIVAGLAMNEEIMAALQPTASAHATSEEEAQEPPRLVNAGAEDCPSDTDSIWSGLRPTPMKPARGGATAARDGAMMPLREEGLLGHPTDMGGGVAVDLFGDMYTGADAAGASGSGSSGDTSGRSANNSANARAWQGLQAIVGRTSSALSHASDASDKSDLPSALTPTRPKAHVAHARAGVTPYSAPSAQKVSRLIRGHSACSDASDASSARGGPLVPPFGIDSRGTAGDARLGLSPPPNTPARQGNVAEGEEEEEEGDVRDIFLPQRAPSALGGRDNTPTRLSKRARSLVLQGILQGASDTAAENKGETEVTHVFPSDRTCVFAGLSVQVRSDAYVYLPPQVSLVQVEEPPAAPDQLHRTHVQGYGMQSMQPTPVIARRITPPEYFLQIPENFDFSEMMYPSSRGPQILDSDSAAREAPGRWVHLPRAALESLLARAGARIEPGCDARSREGVVYLYGVQALTQPVKLFLASSPLLLTPQWAIECLLRGSLCSPERERTAAALYLQRLEAVLADGDATTPASVSMDAAVGVGVDVSELAAQFTAERAAILQQSHVHPHQQEQQHAHSLVRALVGPRAATLSDARVSVLAAVIADSAGGTSRDYRVFIRKRQYLFTCPPALRPPSLALALLSIPPHVIISLPAINTPHVDLSFSLRAATMASLALPPALGGHASACACQRVRQWLQDEQVSLDVRVNGSRNAAQAAGEQRLCAHLSDMWRAYTSTSRVAAVTTALAQAPLAELALLAGDESIGFRGAKGGSTASSSSSSSSSTTGMTVSSHSRSPAPLLSSAPSPSLSVLALPQPPLVPSVSLLTLRSQAVFPVYTPYLPAAATHVPSPASSPASTPLAAAPTMLSPPLRVLFCRAALAHWLCRWIAFTCGKVTEAAAAAADCTLSSITSEATAVGAPASGTMSTTTATIGAMDGALRATRANAMLHVQVRHADTRLLDANNMHGTPTPYNTYLWLLTHLTRRVCVPCAELQRDTSHTYNRAESADAAVLCLCQLPAPTLPAAIEQLRAPSSASTSSDMATARAAAPAASGPPESQLPPPSLTLPATLLHPLHSALALLIPAHDISTAGEGSGKPASRKPKVTVSTATGNASAASAPLPWRAQQERLATPTAHALLPLAQVLSSSSTAAPQTEVGMALARTATGTQHCGEQIFAVQLVLLCGLRVVTYHAVHAAAERVRRRVSRGRLSTAASREAGTPQISAFLPPLSQLLSLSTHVLYTPYALLCTYRALRCLEGCMSEVATKSGEPVSWQQRLGIAMHMAKSVPTQRGQAYSASYTRQQAPQSRSGGLVKTDGPFAEHESSSGPASDPHGSLDSSQSASQRRQQGSQSHDSLVTAGSQTATLDAFLSAPTGAADEWHAPIAEAAKQATTTALKVLLDRNRGMDTSNMRKSSNGSVVSRTGSGSGERTDSAGVTSGGGDVTLTGVTNMNAPSPECVSALPLSFTCLLELITTMHTTFRPSAPLSTATMSLCACPATLMEYMSTAFALPHAVCTALATLQHLRNQHPQPQPLRLASLQRAASTRLSQLRQATLFPPAPLHLLLAQLHTRTAAPLRLPFSPSLPTVCPPLCGLTVWVDPGYVFTQPCGATPRLQPQRVVAQAPQVGLVGEGANISTVCYACAKAVMPISITEQPLAATSSSSTATSVFVSDGGCGNLLCFLTRHLHQYLSHSSLPSLPQRVCLAHTHFPGSMTLPPALPLSSSALDPLSIPHGPVHLLSSLLPAHVLPRVSLAPYLAPHVLHTRMPAPLQRMVSVLEVAGAAITPALGPLLAQSHPRAHAIQAGETKTTGGKSVASPHLPAVRACLDALDRSQVWFGHAGVVIRDCTVNGSMDDVFPSHTSPAQPCHCYLCELRLLLSNLPDVCVLAVMQRKGGAQLPLQQDVLLSQYHQHVAHLRTVLDVARQLFAADMQMQTTLLQQGVQRAYERGGMDSERARKTAEGHVQRAVRWVMRKLQGMRMVHTGWVTALQSIGETYDGDKRGTIEYAKFLVQPPSA